jgi:serine/threonine protein kinase
MILEISKISESSILDQGTAQDINFFERIQYDDNAINEGGFGKIHRIYTIDGLKKDNLLLKIFYKKEHNEHSYDTIKYLHIKLKRFQKQKEICPFLVYPELLGLPFITFKGVDEVLNEGLVGFVMYDLGHLGYQDYGLESVQAEGFDLIKASFLSFQLAKVISFLHEIKFMHSDMKENALFIHPVSGRLAIIDFDSGYHMDLQEKPITGGTLIHWARNLGKNLLNISNLGKKDRSQELLFEETWIVTNAIFQFYTNLSTPYFFLKDGDKKVKSRYLKSYRWPNIDSKFKYLIPGAEFQMEELKSTMDKFRELGLDSVFDAFERSFNEGFEDNSKLTSLTEWISILKEILEGLDYRPEGIELKSSLDTIHRPNQKVDFSWSGSQFNYVLVEGKPAPLFSDKLSLGLLDQGPVNFKFVNDFFNEERSIYIKADKKVPKILLFESDNTIRDSELPINIYWKVLDAEKISISEYHNLKSDGDIEVFPVKDRNYKITAIGYFGEVSTDEIWIEVVKPKIISFIHEINIEHGIDNVDLIWETENTISVEIQPLIGLTNTSGFAHVNLEGKTQFTLIAKGLFGAVAKVIEAKPFPLPIIKELMVQFPQIEINTNITQVPLKIPDPLKRLSQIQFTNTINFKPRDFEFDKVDLQFNSKLPDFNLDINLLNNRPDRKENFFKRIISKVKSELKTRLKP